MTMFSISDDDIQHADDTAYYSAYLYRKSCDTIEDYTHGLKLAGEYTQCDYNVECRNDNGGLVTVGQRTEFADRAYPHPS